MGLGGTTKSCFLLILLVLALINSGRRLLTAPVASQQSHTKHLLQVLQGSPTVTSRGLPSTTASHSPQCCKMMGFAVSQHLRSKEPENKMEEEKQRETNGQRRKEIYRKQKRNQSQLIWFNSFAAGISKYQEN